MLTKIRDLSGRAAGEESGFTLVELLVTMLAGMVVLSALFTIMDVTLHPP
jgi:Tfp pilus assembly protein PilW